MTPNRARENSLRLDQFEYTRLAWALALSLALHLFGFGTYEIGKKYHLWQSLHLPSWLQKVTRLTTPRPPKNEPDQVPLMYVDVSPQQATTEAPKDAKYYSAHNSQANNPEADQDTGGEAVS